MKNFKFRSFVNEQRTAGNLPTFSELTAGDSVWQSGDAAEYHCIY